jgi:hypothetical protein
MLLLMGLAASLNPDDKKSNKIILRRVGWQKSEGDIIAQFSKAEVQHTKQLNFLVRKPLARI